MQNAQGTRRYSASDLVNFAACAHLTHLDRVHLDTPLPKAEDTEEMALIQDKGFEHERRYWAHLQREHADALDLGRSDLNDAQRFEATRAAMNHGHGVLFQATLLADPWVGHADFLIRVDLPSRLGDFSYEVADTKLARSSRAKFLVQLCLYSELLARVQGVMPQQMHVVLGDGRRETYRVDDYLRYFRRLSARFLQWADAPMRVSTPERVDRCDSCRWRERCGARWLQDDHLNRVAGITRTQIARLTAAGVTTLDALGRVGPEGTVARIQSDTLQRLAQQARLQAQAAATGEPVHEVLPMLADRGLCRLPKPAPGDLFFDMEGDPLETGGLEYLFGVQHFDGDSPGFRALWAHTRREERAAFEAFIDYVVEHLRRHPGAHIYHYAPYESTALKRLMSLHGTREAEVDNLLRQRTMVDLYAVVREGVRVGEPSYSIKSLECFYRAQARKGEVTTAGASIVHYERWKKTGEAALLQGIENYNRDDVLSTFELRQWLLTIRPAMLDWKSITHPFLSGQKTESAPELSEKALQKLAEMERFRQYLVDDLPDDRLTWTDTQRVRELMFHLLGFHRRADKPAWWSLFSRMDASEEDLIDDMEALAGLAQLEPPVRKGRSARYRYGFPAQETRLKTGDACTITATGQAVNNLTIDETTLQVGFTLSSPDPLPASGIALGLAKPISTEVIVGAVQRFVQAWLDDDPRYQAGLSFLRRELPSVRGVAPGAPLLAAGEDLVAGTSRLVAGLRASHLFIQGPPGAGKTYTGSHVIVDLLRAGKRVAVTSNSHKAINNLLRGVEKVARETGFEFRGAKKSTQDKPESCLDGSFIEDVFKAKDIANRLETYALVAGTAWVFSSADFDRAFDHLFVDEAGQVSLANLIAMSTCAENLVLLGDQMQLGQPIQGVHPGESGQSTLEYLLQEQTTIAPERGVFLRDTWRMHPDVCRFISDAVYSGRLEAEAKNSRQQLLLDGDVHPAVRPTGISFIAVDHDGCSQRSEEEGAVIRDIVEDLLRQRYVDREGAEHPMTLENILVVAPYNQQVNRLKLLLPEGARVGTVDRFQGQEAEAVLVSMTTSSSEYLPRHIEFLYSRNRLNVAISRARCWVGVVASPRLMDVSVQTPEQMGLVNMLCWVNEYSGERTPAQDRRRLT